MWDLVKDILYPPACAHCGKSVTRLGDWCPQCFADLYDGKALASSVKGVQAIWSVAHYSGGVRSLIHDIKFNKKKELGKSLTPFLERFSFLWQREGKRLPWDYVVPIPVSESRRQARGYNQVDVIFKPWVENNGLVWLDCLHKWDTASDMWKLTGRERLANMKGAFSLKDEYKKTFQEGRSHILLVDDIYTTGATLAEAASALKWGPVICDALVIGGSR